MLSPTEQADLLKRLQQRTITKREIRVALLKMEGKFIPATPAHGQPESEEDRAERMRLNPEQFYLDKPQTLQNLGREMVGLTALAQSVLKKFAPGIGAPTATDDFFERRKAAEEEKLRSRGGVYGGITAREEGAASTLAATQIPVSEARARNLPETKGTAEGIKEHRGIVEFLVGSAPYQTVKAGIETPGGALSHPSLAAQRMRGTLAQHLEASPLQTVLETVGLGVVGGQIAKPISSGILGISKAVRGSLSNTLGKEYKIAQEAVSILEEEATKAVNAEVAKGTPVDGILFEKAKEEASKRISDRLAKFGKSVVDRNALFVSLRPFAEDLARAANAEIAQRGKSGVGITAAELRKMAEQIGIESQSRKMFPYSPIPRPELPQSLRDLFNALPDRVFTGLPPNASVTADDVLRTLVPPVPTMPTDAVLALPKPNVMIGGKMVEGEIGEGFVTSPGKLTSARVAPKKIKVMPGGTKDLSEALAAPKVKKGAVEFRPAISKTSPEAAGSAVKGAEFAETAGPLVADVVVPETGPAVFRSNLANTAFRAVKKMAASPAAKALVGAMDNSFTEHHLTAGRWIEGLRDVGLHKFESSTRENILLELSGKPTNDMLAKGASAHIRKSLDEVADIVEKLGIMVDDGQGNMRAWTRRKDYAPLMVKPEILDALYNDVAKAMKKARKKVGDGVSDDVLHDVLTSMHEKGELRLSEQTRRAIDHVIKTERAKNAGEALSFLGRRSFTDKYRFFGNIDAGRTAHLPLDMYERDAARVLPEYLYGAARRIAEAKHLGPNNEKLELLLKQIAKTNTKEADYFNRVAEIFLGHKDRAFIQSNPGLKKLYDYYTNYAVATKIGLGTATIPNITQFAISTLPVFGVQRTAKAALRVAFDPAYRSSLRERGVILSEAMRKIMQQEFGGTAGEVTEKLLVPFEAVNRAQKYIAAAAMDDAYDDLVRMATSKTDPGYEQALRIFARLGVSPEQLGTKAGRDKAIFKFAAQSQLQKSVIEEPLLLNMPSMQPLVLFKRFGWRQAEFINDWVVKEFREGNVVPTLRLLAAGYAGGKFVVEAKKQLRQALSGQKVWSPTSAWWKDAARAYSEVGSIGVFADLWRIKGEMPEDIWTDLVDNGVFIISPPFVSDIARGAKLGKAVGGDIAERGTGPALRRSSGRIGATLGGSLFGSATERFKTAAQVEDEIKNRRNKTLDDIKSLMVTGKAKRGVALMDQWNKTFPEYYIEPPTPDELSKTLTGRVAKQTEIPVELLR